MRRPTESIVSLMTTLVTSLLVLAIVAPAAAQEAGSGGAMLIILDASGSMNSVDEDGVPFIDKAKAAVVELVNALPDDIEVGLRVYGHREDNTDRTVGCLDTELIAPVGPIDPSAIALAIAGINASGYTPIGLSLQEAASDLPATGARTIVLISDGEDTCAPPDPCTVAAELFGEAIDVRIESVGFLVDSGSAAEQQLRCIADSSGGTYRTVGLADELVAALGEVATDALKWAPPIWLNGGLEQALAPDVPLTVIPDWFAQEQPTTAHSGDLMTVIMPGETRWFLVDTWVGEGFATFAEFNLPPGSEVSGALEAIIIAPDGSRTEAAIGGTPTRTDLVPGNDAFVAAQNVDPPGGGNRADGPHLVGFHWDAPDGSILASLRYQIEVSGDYRDGDRLVLEGSLDPESAPTLDLTAFEENGPTWRGDSYYGPITAGETRWYRVNPEGRGELNVFATFPADRTVGTGLAGLFTVEIRNGDGESVGIPFDATPQTQARFGDTIHQAEVSISAALDSSSSSAAMLIGFSWEGDRGDSVIRFDVETFTNPDEIGSDQPESRSDAQPQHSEPQGASLLPLIVAGVLLGGAGAGTAWFLQSRRRRSV